ncbi:MAG: hypothetical protein RIS75_1384 [Actinomycetota bacterium]
MMLSPTQSEIENMKALVSDVVAARVRTAPNPRVGCRIITSDGVVISQGIHGEDGIHHAEVIALQRAGDRARGATAIVTLEPCAHTGKTGPCAEALIDAGVSRVIYGSSDSSIAAGGQQVLEAAGIHVLSGVEVEATDKIIEIWKFATDAQRPFVTLKIASTLDGYVAAADGTSRWITGPEAREFVHRLRSQVDAIAVGTNTALVDDPSLDVRLEGEWTSPQAYILGKRTLPNTLRLDGRYIQIKEHEPATVLSMMFEQGVRHVMIEGGATLAAAFIKVDLVDQMFWCTAPALLGSGTSAMGDLGISTIDQAVRWDIQNSAKYGADLITELKPRRLNG